AAPTVGWMPLLAGAALAGPVAGVALALAAWASAGSLGGGHLAEVGPRAWPLAGIAAGLVAAGAVVAAAATKTLIGARRRGA
ncbi:MAG: rane protein, partial [Dactylosporangium sp.]|nr:rane protein [Dactylosporangium sp.]